MKAKKRYLPLAFGVLFLALLVLSCLTTAAKPDPLAARVGKVQAIGQISDGRLQVEIRPAEDETWPAAGAVRVWLARIDGTTVVEAAAIDDRRVDGVIGARLSLPATNGEEALYLLRYRIGEGGAAVGGSFSLAEVLGSLQLHVLGPKDFQAGSQGAIRVLVADRFSGLPLTGAEVRVALAGKEQNAVVYAGLTDQQGTCDIGFAIPGATFEAPQMKVTAKWQGQETEIAYAVNVRHDAKILLTTDKPLYQPGQTMHLRGLALGAGNRLPVARQEAWLEVQDSKGNKVFKKKILTDEFGILHADFPLADEVNMGVYQIHALVGETKAEKTVEVKRYVLPKFKVAIEGDRQWYLPGAVIKGTLKADYIFGKPVNGGTVTVEGLATIVGVETFATIQGKTDNQGRFAFELKLPDTLVGREVDQGKARVQLHATVTDPAGHAQEALRSFPVAKSPLIVQVLPESGQLVGGVPNKIYALVTAPDGTPVKAWLQARPGQAPRADNWWREPGTVASDRLGLAEFSFDVPNDSGFTLSIRARDEGGNEVSETLRLRPERQAIPLLLRTDQPTYRLGETMQLTVLSGAQATQTVYFDLVREGQTLLTSSATLTGHQTVKGIPITAEMTGGIAVTAYVFSPNGNLIRDSRVIYVQPQSDLQVDIRPGRDTYRPGEQARISFQVADNQGHPVAAALGITIVDEAVFALQDMQPGLEKIFFTLEKELMTPRYEFHRFTPDDLVLRPDGDPVRQRGQQVMLAAVEPLFQPAVDQQIANDLKPAVREALQKQVQDDLKEIGKLYEKHDGRQNEIAVGDLLDPWYTPYRLNASGKMVYQITSAGPDRKFYTPDDLVAVNEQLGRRRGRLEDFADGDVMFKAGAAMPEAAARGGMMRNEVAAEQALDKEKKDQTGGEDSKAEAGGGIRIREYFPETLYVNPALITDGQGRASIDLPMADSITTWRIAAQAVSRNGWLGSGTGPVRVFQDFFIDVDFPAVLTRHDIVKVPIALYNYLPTPQTVTLQIQPAAWFELLEGGLTRTVQLGPNEVKAEYLALKALNVGRNELTVTAKGSKQSDAVKRAVLVEPNGKLFEQNLSDRLENEKRHTITMPAEAIPGAGKLLIKVHSGLLSQVVEGLENIFRMPNGCFEQTSSTTYPNVMVLDYLKAVNKLTPEIQMKAEGFINQGYQRLLTFEVPGGGFEWFGNPPAHIILTAYGLMEFFDMSRVYNVDPNVISRTQDWLARQQQADGSWKPTEHYLDQVASAFAKDVLRNTAYVTWALARSGYQGPALAKGRSYLEAHHAEAKDTYTLALLAVTLADAKGAAKVKDDVFARLDAQRHDENEISYWTAGGEATAINSRGQSADIETTALAALAYLHDKRQPQTVNRIVNYLVRSKDTFGTYYSTQATVWALQVLLDVARGGGQEINGQIEVRVNGQAAGQVKINPDNADVLHQIDASSYLHEGDNEVVLSFAGKGNPAYQVVSRYYIPWNLVEQPSQQEPIAITVGYDKTRLAVDEEVTCTVTVTNRVKGEFGMVVVDIGVPPGFQPVSESLGRLVESRQISKYSTTARQVTFYLDKLTAGKPVTLSFRLKAVFAMKAVAPQSQVYNYYDPATKALAQPIALEVK
ncbi:MAG: hypothetical protein GX444_12920 [Myxococcales bacterium]|nr:hypothetical protein [Myxococcales bacterium]